MTTNLIKVGTIPGQINEYAVNSGTTVAQALEMAGLSAEGFEARLDGTTVSLDAVIPTGAQLLVLVKKIKGNADTIKIGIIPGAINEYGYETEMTVAEAFELAGLKTEGYEARMDGEAVEMDDIADGELLVLVKKIKGNR